MNNFLKKIDVITLPRVHAIISLIEPYLKHKAKILDMGCGTGHVSSILQERGHSVIGIDSRDRALFKNFEFHQCTADQVNFPDNYFDHILIFAVLHHIPKEQHPTILQQCHRMIKKDGTIIILEDVYDNALQKYATFFFDSLLNMEFFNHPRANSTVEGWKKFFSRLDLKVINVFQYSKRYLFTKFRHAIFILQKNNALSEG